MHDICLLPARLLLRRPPLTPCRWVLQYVTKAREAGTMAPGLDMTDWDVPMEAVLGGFVVVCFSMLGHTRPV